jgi:hypothetical protein
VGAAHEVADAIREPACNAAKKGAAYFLRGRVSERGAQWARAAGLPPPPPPPAPHHQVVHPGHAHSPFQGVGLAVGAPHGHSDVFAHVHEKREHAQAVGWDCLRWQHSGRQHPTQQQRGRYLRGVASQICSACTARNGALLNIARVCVSMLCYLRIAQSALGRNKSVCDRNACVRAGDTTAGAHTLTESSSPPAPSTDSQLPPVQGTPMSPR